MVKFMNKKTRCFLLFLSLFLLSGCAEFNGLRQARYDGKPIIKNEKAIAHYRQSAEVIEKEKEYYLKEAFSEDILQASLDYSEKDPVLLREGRYIIGEDLTEGRVTLLGNESVFTGENFTVHVGNMKVSDEKGQFYFENLFHTAYGQQLAQVDFIAGHEIEIIGKDSEITVFYTDQLPEDPYLLMDLPPLLERIDHEEVKDPIIESKVRGRVDLSAGVYEVGVHLKAASYQIEHIEAPHHTVMYVFKDTTEPDVIELLVNSPNELSSPKATIKLEEGNKIYLQLVKNLSLKKIE